MPLYEEKLISPLAVRFCQGRIKNSFQDGRDCERTALAIETDPGKGGYDAILRAPFPAIEIIRWRPKNVMHDQEAGCTVDLGVPADGHYWFTLDNRRLYCLQRAALRLWPRRVAAVVQILYADPGQMRRKYDSVTGGQSVSIGRCLEEPLAVWDWREKLPMCHSSGAGAAAQSAALAIISKDTCCITYDALQDAPEPPSMLEAFLQGLGASQRCATPSTKVGSDASGEALDSNSDAQTSHHDEKPPRRSGKSHKPSASCKSSDLEDCSDITGVWVDENEVEYVVEARGKNSFVAFKSGNSSKRFGLKSEEGSSLLWWGGGKTHFLDRADAHSGELNWYTAADTAKECPRFVWWRKAEAGEKSAGKSRGRRSHWHGRRQQGRQQKQ
eukprot:TRINITY_DN16850_c0_g1_i3.p1 TRINITY_DN16850_c0_g1~~TRINITY_DN16850_c0_g1_i3.p1  ORF type:complete len:385 (+),score=54.08 TRINITY_DN16850_c0_g1_i3:96-1250(+)